MYFFYCIVVIIQSRLVFQELLSCVCIYWNVVDENSIDYFLVTIKCTVKFKGEFEEF